MHTGGVRYGVLDAGGTLNLPLRGFRVASSDGGVFARALCTYGSAAGLALHAPIVGMTLARPGMELLAASAAAPDAREAFTQTQIVKRDPALLEAVESVAGVDRVRLSVYPLNAGEHVTAETFH